MKDSADEKIIAQKINLFEEEDANFSGDTRVLWGRLEKSLNKKTAKKVNIYQYWPAGIAAVLIIALFIAVLLPKQNKAIHVAALTPSRQDITIPGKKESADKTQQHGEIAATQHKLLKKRWNKPAGKNKYAVRKRQNMMDIEDANPPGMYAAPVVNEVCYNTTITDGLACY